MSSRRRPGRIRALLGKVGRGLAFAASLPERAIRSVAAAGGGVSRLATDTALPRSFRRTRLFKFLVGNFQRFLIEDVGRVRGAYASADRLPKHFLARKTVGDLVEAAGIVAVRYSPLWFFALLGTAAAGSRRFLNRVVRELKKDKVLAPDAKVGSAEELLKALERASMKSVLPFDAPPLSLRDLNSLRREISGEYRRLYRTTRKSLPSPEALWRRLMRVRAREAIPFLRLSGALALSAGKVSGKLFQEKLVRSYAASLDEVRKEGFAKYFASASRPYLEALAGAFKPRQLTTTERLLTRRKK